MTTHPTPARPRRLALYGALVVVVGIVAYVTNLALYTPERAGDDRYQDTWLYDLALLTIAVGIALIVTHVLVALTDRRSS